jgi:hypothetical protein
VVAVSRELLLLEFDISESCGLLSTRRGWLFNLAMLVVATALFGTL